MARRPTAPAWPILAVVGSLLVGAERASAEPKTFSLDWRAPASCPTSDFVSVEIARLLGHAPGLVSDRSVSVEATVLRVGNAFTVTILLTTSEGRGERTLRDDSCERVALATALVVSLTIDPDAVTAQKSAPPPPPVTPAPAPPPPLPPERDRARPRRRFVAGAESAVDFGILPDPGARLSAMAGLSWRALRYEITVGYDFPQYAAAPGQISRGANLRLATLGARACLAPLDGTIEMDACLSAEGGLFFAEGVSISAPLTERYPWVAALVGARLEWHPLDSFSVRFEADGGTSLVRPSFEITGSLPTFVYEPSRFVAKGTLGAVVRFR